MKKGILASTLIVAALILGACGEEAGSESDSTVYKRISSDGLLVEYEHIETGCHYTKYASYDFTQMFIEKDGRTVPYCN